MQSCHQQPHGEHLHHRALRNGGRHDARRHRSARQTALQDEGPEAPRVQEHHDDHIPCRHRQPGHDYGCRQLQNRATVKEGRRQTRDSRRPLALGAPDSEERRGPAPRQRLHAGVLRRHQRLPAGALHPSRRHRDNGGRRFHLCTQGQEHRPDGSGHGDGTTDGCRDAASEERQQRGGARHSSAACSGTSTPSTARTSSYAA